MNKIIPSIIQDNGEYYIHMEEYKKVKELGDHYKHLYSEVKKQKDDVVEYIKEIKKHREEGLTITEYKTKWRSMFDYLESDEIINNLLRMLGEIE